MKSIFPGISYNDILNDTGLRTLKERRNVLCMKYFAGIQGSAHKLNGLRKVDYDLRPGFNRYPLTSDVVTPLRSGSPRTGAVAILHRIWEGNVIAV